MVLGTPLERGEVEVKDVVRVDVEAADLAAGRTDGTTKAFATDSAPKARAATCENDFISVLW